MGYSLCITLCTSHPIVPIFLFDCGWAFILCIPSSSLATLHLRRMSSTHFVSQDLPFHSVITSWAMYPTYIGECQWTFRLVFVSCQSHYPALLSNGLLSLCLKTNLICEFVRFRWDLGEIWAISTTVVSYVRLCCTAVIREVTQVISSFIFRIACSLQVMHTSCKQKRKQEKKKKNRSTNQQ